MRDTFLRAYEQLYQTRLRPLIFQFSAQDAHARMIRWLRWADDQSWLMPLFGAAHSMALPASPVEVGGITLRAPLILAAGLVKGDGFASEPEARDAVRAGRNIIPGWRALPRLVGLVEFGSFTRWPRVGNPGTVMWRDVDSQSTQNRVGLRNPGALAAAEFLAQRRDRLPQQYGINVAISPGVSEPDQQTGEALDSFRAFVTRQVFPTWFTLNLSCPNTEDDPGGNQTAALARQVCGAVIDYLNSAERVVPLWVKVGPCLSDEQYHALMAEFDAVGVRAVVATNTLAKPAPADPELVAGVGGAWLHEHAVTAARALFEAKSAHGYAVDIVGCGGVADRATMADFAGARAVQYWSALVYRGPLAAALIAREGNNR